MGLGTWCSILSMQAASTTCISRPDYRTNRAVEEGLHVSLIGGRKRDAGLVGRHRKRVFANMIDRLRIKAVFISSKYQA